VAFRATLPDKFRGLRADGKTPRRQVNQRRGKSDQGRQPRKKAADAQARAGFFELMKANPDKSEAEIHAMMRAA
jgi:hypothetical protein